MFYYFLQLKPRFCSKELMIWATVSSRSCFYWLYRAFPPLAAKNIINLILILTIWTRRQYLQWCDWQAINFQQRDPTTQKQKTNNPIKKWAEDLNRHFSKEDIEMSDRYMKRLLSLIITREIKIKTKLRYHFTQIRMTIIKKSTNVCRRGHGENGTFLYSWWEHKVVQLLRKTV